MSATSIFGHGIAVEGMLLQMDNGASPDSFVTIANVTDISIPVIADVVDVTNVGDNWRSRIPTLHDMGKIAFSIFWQMEDPTHNNAVGGGSIPSGLRYNLINNQLRNYQLMYYNLTTGLFVGVDAWPGYVTSFAITGKTGSVWMAKIEIVNSAAPSLV
jgi:hypothetical protein